LNQFIEPEGLTVASAVFLWEATRKDAYMAAELTVPAP